MTRRASAAPYAKALFDIAVQDGTAEPVGREIATLAGLVAEHADLQKVLTHPAVPQRAKRDVVDRLATLASVSTPVRKLLGLMADRDRLALLPQLHQAYQARLMKHLQVVEAHVTTAVPLPADRADVLARSLERATGKQVRLTTAVDPAIMGGVVARLGSTVLDGSVVRQLERLRGQLVEEA